MPPAGVVAQRGSEPREAAENHDEHDDADVLNT